MADLERFKQAQLNNALTTGGESSRRSLSKEDLSRLLVEMESCLHRWPSQDQEDIIEKYFQDFESLALKFSVTKVLNALKALRITPGQRFYPPPDVVAEEIERQREADLEHWRAQKGDMWLADQERDRNKLLTSEEEIAWRREKFGYDPYTEKKPEMNELFIKKKQSGTCAVEGRVKEYEEGSSCVTRRWKVRVGDTR